MHGTFIRSSLRVMHDLFLVDGTFIQEQIDSDAGAVKPLPVCYLQRPAFAPIRVTGSPWTESDGEECRSEPFRLKWRRPLVQMIPQAVLTYYIQLVLKKMVGIVLIFTSKTISMHYATKPGTRPFLFHPLNFVYSHCSFNIVPPFYRAQHALRHKARYSFCFVCVISLQFQYRSSTLSRAACTMPQSQVHVLFLFHSFNI